MARYAKGYFHGGQRGLRVGTMLLPPSKTGARNTLADAAEKMGHEGWDRDHVYVTPSFGDALLYAAGHPSDGWVYLVEPVGELGSDPDCMQPGLSFRVPQARIVRAFVPTKSEKRAALGAILGGR